MDPEANRNRLETRGIEDDLIPNILLLLDITPLSSLMLPQQRGLIHDYLDSVFWKEGKARRERQLVTLNYDGT